MADDPDQDIVPVKEANCNSNLTPKETVPKQFLMKLNRGELEDRNYRLMEENTNLKRQNLDMTEKYKRLSAKLSRLMDKEKPRGPVEARQNFQLRLEIDEKDAKISELEVAKSRLEERVLVMKNQMAEHERLHSRSQRTRGLIKSPRRTSSAITAPFREDTKTIDILKSENSALKEEISALKKELEYVKAQSASKLSDLERKLAENLSDEQKRQHSESLEMMRLKRALKKQAAELSVLQTENQLREKDLHQSRKTIEEMHAESEKLEKELSDKNNQVTELKYSLDTLKRDMRNIEELQQEIEDHKKEISTLKEYRTRMLSLTASPNDSETEGNVQAMTELTNKIKELENKLMSESVEKALLLSTVDELKQRIAKFNNSSSFNRKQLKASEHILHNGQTKGESSAGSEVSVSHVFLQNFGSLPIQQTEETAETKLEQKFSDKINQLEKKLEEEQAQRKIIMKLLLEEREEKEKRLRNSNMESHISGYIQAEPSSATEIPNTHMFLQNLASRPVESSEQAIGYQLEQRLSERINQLEKKLEEGQSHRNTVLRLLSEKHEDKKNRLGTISEKSETQVTRYVQANGPVSCATQTESDIVRDVDEDVLGKTLFSTKKYCRSNSTGAYSQIPSLKQTKAVMCSHFMIDKLPLQEDRHNFNTEDSTQFKDLDPVDESTSTSLEIGLPYAIASAIHNTSVDSNEDDTQISAASNVSLSAGEILPAPHSTSGAKLLQSTMNNRSNSKTPGGSGVVSAAAYVEKLQELTKYQELLRVQYNLNSTYKKEMSSLSHKLCNKHDNEDKNHVIPVLNKYVDSQSKYKLGTNTVRETTLRRQHSIPLGYDQGVFEFHIQRLTLTDEGSVIMKNGNPSLMISWVFFNQDANCTPVKTGTDITFDYSVVYRVEVNHLFLDYLKNRDCTLELQVISEDIPQNIGRGSLSFTEILEYPDNKLHSSVQMVSIQDDNHGVILGIVECWFRMKCSSALLGKLKIDSAYQVHQASQKVTDTVTYSSKTEDEANTLTSEPSSSSSPVKQPRPVPIPRRRRLSKNGKDKESVESKIEDEVVPDGILPIVVTHLSFSSQYESHLDMEMTQYYVKCTLLDFISVSFGGPGKFINAHLEFNYRNNISVFSNILNAQELINILIVLTQKQHFPMLKFFIFTKSSEQRLSDTEFGHADFNVLKFMQFDQDWIKVSLPFINSDGNEIGLLEVIFGGILSMKKLLLEYSQNTHLVEKLQS